MILNPFQITFNLLSIDFKLLSTTWSQGFINYGEPWSLIMGDMGSWGVPFVSLPNWCFYSRIYIIGSRSSWQGCFFHKKSKKQQWWERKRKKKREKLKSTNKDKKAYFSAVKCNEQCCSLYIHTYMHDACIQTDRHTYISWIMIMVTKTNNWNNNNLPIQTIRILEGDVYYIIMCCF